MKSSKVYLLPFLFLLSLCGYLLISYGIERSQFSIFIAAYGALFLCYFLSVTKVDTANDIKWAVIAALLFRAALIFSVPTLSNDVYRFIWDGQLLAHGINPFGHIPQFYVQQGLPTFLSAELYQQLSSLSQVHFTVYPAVCQYIFGFAANIAGTNIFANITVLKTMMLVFEAGTFWLVKKLLDHFNLPIKYLLFYALNPLIILELTGNLHFEGVMIFFLLAAFYLFVKQRFGLALLCFLLAVNTKLIPLILVPYLFFSLGLKRALQLTGILIAGTVLLHIPFIDPQFITHFADSLALYFQSFEFNASLYYLVRWAGYQAVGYNIIHTAAPVLAVTATCIIIFVSWMKRDSSLKNMPTIYIVIVTIYYLFSTTVHPWYITSLIAFVPLTGYYFPLAWSAVIPFTYIAYSTTVYYENLWLVAIEYLIVAIVIYYDYTNREKPVFEQLQRMRKS